MAEKIIDTINKIADATDEKYAQALVDGINIGVLIASAPKDKSEESA